MGRGHEWTFFQTRYTNGLQTQRKMHNTPKSSGKQKLKIKNKTTIQSSDLTSGYFCKEKENTNWKIYMGTAIFNAALFAIAKVQKQSECPLIDE